MWTGVLVPFHTAGEWRFYGESERAVLRKVNDAIRSQHPKRTGDAKTRLRRGLAVVVRLGGMARLYGPTGATVRRIVR